MTTMLSMPSGLFFVALVFGLFYLLVLIYRKLPSKKLRHQNITEFESSLTAEYKGAVISAEFSRNFSRVHDSPPLTHLLAPDGSGHICYKNSITQEIYEEYIGSFKAGVYHGTGRLTRRGVVMEGVFEEGVFVNNKKS